MGACSDPLSRAAAYGELARSSSGKDDTRKFEKLQDSLASRADNEQVLADQYVDAVNAGETERLRGAALAAERRERAHHETRNRREFEKAVSSHRDHSPRRARSGHG